MGKIIILGSEKGGVAKTTSTYNLAYCLAKLPFSVSTANEMTCLSIKPIPFTIHTLLSALPHI